MSSGVQTGKKVSVARIVEDIQDVCKVRQINELNCRGCKYYGKACDHAINYLKEQVKRPTEIALNKEEN